MRSTFLLLALLMGCTSAEPRRPQATREEAPPRAHETTAHAAAPHESCAQEACGQGQAASADTPPAPGGPRDFGAHIDDSRPLTPLAEIVAAPAAHAEQVVRTRGVVHRVCQRMGCWMELRDGEGPPVRVPMAGHAFFLPRDCQGAQAEIEGRVVIQELSAAAREHLGGEGATALASTVSIDATGVHLF
jgi:hypothetical protein